MDKDGGITKREDELMLYEHQGGGGERKKDDKEMCGERRDRTQHSN